ncbi:MAG: hypothetical protein JWO46_3088 [Nocardioidaceae bacterium]|nr:hypothetical protein [Nocardioidaceae bacterium]
MALRRRGEGGFAQPARLMAFGISAVALAGLVFVATHGGDDSPAKAAPSSSHGSQGTGQGTGGPTGPGGGTPQITTTPKPPPVIKRGKVNVVVFNNTNVKGLAGSTATRVEKAGWNVVTTDNWHGTVDATTVYFGPKMKAAAQLLAQDLGIARVKPSFAPMNQKQLTVNLTADYQ